jgi:hypothetical protein
VCQALPKRMTVDCTVSVTASSTNAASTSIVSRDFAPSTASTSTSRCTRSACRGWNACALLLEISCHGGSRRNQARIAAPGACPSDDQGDRDRARCHRIGKGIDAYQREKIQKLVKLRGVGAEFATVLVGEVFFRPFSNRHQIASYVGLTPSHFQSGSMSRDQGISKAGNPKARTRIVKKLKLWAGRVVIAFPA